MVSLRTSVSCSLLIFVFNMAMAERSEPKHDDFADRFNMQLVFDSFTKCLEDKSALQMDQYLIGFKELFRFFTLLGSVFSFVASDLISKVNILEKYRESPNGDHYVTFQSMIEHETGNGKIKDQSEPSGSRTLLRLHRALEFIMLFMRELSTAEITAMSSTIARKCYQDSLAHYHPWIIRWTASAAMHTLPEKKQFMKTVFGRCDADTVDYSEKLMGDIAQISKSIHDETQKLYESNELLDLP